MSTQHLLPAEPSPDAAAYRLSRAWRLTFVVTLVLLVGLTSGGLLQLPVYSLQPGPARDVTKLVSVRGEQTFPSRGGLLLTTVRVSSHPITLFEGLASVFDPATELVGRSAIVGPGLTDRQQDELNLVEMLQSKYAAAVVAFRAMGRPAARIPGARIVHVFSDAPSGDRLRPGDVVTGVDGAPIGDVPSLTQRIRRHRIGDEVSLRISRGGIVRTEQVRTRRSVDDTGKPIPVVGISLAPAFRFPVDVQIDTQDIGGPSGGLVFSLSIVEVLGRADLTKGHVVAATGTIDLEGRVGEIGGIEQKVRAAEHSGADLFLVPAAEAQDAAKVARTVRILGVRTIEEALNVLGALAPRTR